MIANQNFIISFILERRMANILFQFRLDSAFHAATKSIPLGPKLFNRA